MNNLGRGNIVAEHAHRFRHEHNTASARNISWSSAAQWAGASRSPAVSSPSGSARMAARGAGAAPIWL